MWIKKTMWLKFNVDDMWAMWISSNDKIESKIYVKKILKKY